MRLYFCVMKALRNPRELLQEARGLEQDGKLPEAATVYQRLVDTDPTNQQAVNRLLTIYRKLKEPRKELAAIEAVLSAYAQKDKTSQEKWLSAHPQAAKAGRAFLRSLGNTTASGFGTNPVVGRMQKRKEVVEKKIYGKAKKAAPKAPRTVKKNAAAEKKAAAAAARKAVAESRKAAEAERRVAAAESRRAAAEERRWAAEQRKREAQDKKAEAARKKAEEIAARKAAKAEAAASAKAAAEAKAAAAALPSLFVITLRYLVAQEKIDASASEHNAFLDKHFAAGHFLVAGSQTPQTGAIIIARGKNRAAIERFMKQDPLLRRKLASLDIVEFSASKLDKKQWQQLR